MQASLVSSVRLLSRPAVGKQNLAAVLIQVCYYVGYTTRGRGSSSSVFARRRIVPRHRDITKDVKNGP